jgi:hypothetical protein
MAAGHDQHSGGYQLMPNVSGGPGVPGTGGNANSFGEDVIAAIGDLAELGNGCGQVMLFWVAWAPGSAVQSAVEKLAMAVTTNDAYR